MLALGPVFVRTLSPLALRVMTARVARDEERTEERSGSRLDDAMSRYAAGEAAAFEELYDGLAPRLLAFLFRHTHDRARAEDVVQQTMLRIHAARGRFEPGARVLPWAFAIARRLLIDQHRRGARELLAATDDDEQAALLASVDARADDMAIAKELASHVAAALERLPQNQRVAFELVKLDGLSLAEAAEVLGTTVAAIKLRAHRAYEALRDALAAVEGEGAGGANETRGGRGARGVHGARGERAPDDQKTGGGR